METRVVPRVGPGNKAGHTRSMYSQSYECNGRLLQINCLKMETHCYTKKVLVVVTYVCDCSTWSSFSSFTCSMINARG